MVRSLGKYRIVEHLGRGGMGDVYLAEDTTLKRRVALKLLPADLAGDSGRLERLQREARALAALNHPNIVTIHSVETAAGSEWPERGSGASEEEIHYLTMEHVEGTTLDQVVPKKGLSCRRFFELAIPLAEAVAAAHEKGIVHRDLKPGNVMVSGDGTVKVVDFGLAKSVPRVDSEDVTQLAEEPLTRVGGIVGTMPYMSPEQLEGKRLDGRSDVFSLGAVLYEMATGRRPFAADSSASLIAALLSEEPAQVDEVRADLPHQLARIIRHCLEKDPAHRFQTARDVSNELIDLRDECTRDIERGTARPVTRSRLNRSIVAALGAMVVVAAGWLVWQFLPARRAAAPRSELTRVAVLPFENVGPPTSDYFAIGITDEITSRLAAVGSLGVISRTSARQYAGSTKTLGEIATELDVDYLLEGRVHWSPDGELRVTPALIRASDAISLWNDIYLRVADDIFEVQSEIAQKVVHRLGVALLDSELEALEARPTANIDAYQSFLRARHHAGQPHFTIENWQTVVENLSRAVELDPAYAVAWAELSRAHARFYYLQADRSPERKAEARAAFERAAALAPNAPEVHLATGYYFMWVERDTEVALRELAMAESRMPNSAELLTAKGALLRLQGRWPESQRALERAFELSPREPAISLELAYAYWPTRQYEKALAACEKTIALSPDPEWQTWAHLTKTFNYWSWKGATVEARAALERIPNELDWAAWAWFWQELYEGEELQAHRRLEAVTDRWIRTKIVARPTELLAGILYDSLGEDELAAELFQTARELLEVELESAPDDPRLHASLGIAWAALGRPEEAVREGERAVELLPLVEDAFYGIPYVLDLAFIHTLLGRDEAALDQIELLLEQPSWVSPALLEVDPRFDRLRRHPRFIGLTTRHSKLLDLDPSSSGVDTGSRPQDRGR